MRYIWQHIHDIVQDYNGSLPLAHYLKNHFRKHPKLGSRDRKILSDMAYSWYRCSKGITASRQLSFEEQVAACLYLCQPSKHSLQFIPEAWRNGNSLAEHDISFSVEQLLPHDVQLSDGITRRDWLSSMLTQPRLFIRTRKQHSKVLQLLSDADIAYEQLTDTCLSLPNGAAIDKLLPPDSYVVQDASSQQTGAYFHPKANEQWYDCCSGAGGKSLLLKDIEPTVQLTVSDRRASIMHNLEERFKLYHHKLPRKMIVDMSNKEQLAAALAGTTFDNIICDAPCSGSGTWARTPEQLYFFDPAAINTYSQLQHTIASNVAPYLRTGGRMLYITCSVFRQENEDVVATLVKNSSLQLQEMNIINGIDKKADSMFIAVLQKA